MGQDRRNNDERRHAQADGVVFPHRHKHIVGARVAGQAAKLIQPQNGQAGERKQVDDPAVGFAVCSGEVHRLVERAADRADHGANQT